MSLGKPVGAFKAKEQYNHFTFIFKNTNYRFMACIHAYYYQLTKDHEQSNKVDGKSTKELKAKANKLALSTIEKKEYHFSDEVNPVLPTMTSKGVTCVQFQAIETALKISKKKLVKNYASELIKLVFQCEESFANCFLSEDGLKETNFTKGPFIDYEQVNSFYELINSKEKYKNLYIETLKTLNSNIEKNLCSYENPFYLRQFIILSLNPIFMDPENYKYLLSILNHIPKLEMNISLYQVLIDWFAIVPRKIFEKILTMCQQFVTMLQLLHNFPKSDLEPCLKYMEILFKANKMREDKLEPSAFHNGEASTKNLEITFRDWVKSEFSLESKLFSFCYYPFVLDSAAKYAIMKHENEFIKHQHVKKKATELAQYSRSIPIAHLILFLYINRSNLTYSSLTEIEKNKDKLNYPLRVEFVGEEGVDEGGLTKEFFLLIVREIFNEKWGMFSYNKEQRLFWFSRTYQKEDLRNYYLIGTVIGLALFNSVILDVKLPLALYKMLLGKQPDFEDLKSVDEVVYNNMKKILEYEGEEDLGITYSVDIEVYGEYKSIDLIKNGSNISVTKENKRDYVDKYVNWFFNTSISEQFNQFYTGFKLVCKNRTMKLLVPEDLELFVCGNTVLNFEELQKVTQYGKGFNKNKPIIKKLWEIVKGYDMKNKKRFLAFCTGSDRVPINGLKGMEFFIVKNGDDPKRLPTAHTCFNHLLLPDYKNLDILKERLTLAISNYQGFGLK